LVKNPTATTKGKERECSATCQDLVEVQLRQEGDQGLDWFGPYGHDVDVASPSQSEGQPEPVYKTTTKPFDALDWKLYQFMRDNEEELADHYMGGLPGPAPEDDPVSSVGAE